MAAAGNVSGNGSRTSAWGVRYDFTAKTLYDTRRVKDFLSRWTKAIETMASSPTEASLGTTVDAIGKDLVLLGGTWRNDFLNALKNAPAGELASALQKQLDSTVAALAAADPQFMPKVHAAQNAIGFSYEDRDAVLRDLQSNKFSVEFNSLHPLGQPNMSNVRAIYSYQPSSTALLLTANFGAEWYDITPTGIGGRLRDIQAALQADRRLGEIPNFGPAVLTGAFYYQWMRENAVINIPSGNTAPGSGIVLPGPASTLLAPKGNIAIGQIKLSVPLKNGTIKIPVSLTWSNRTELIDAPEKKAQVGLELDLDSFFGK